MALNSLFAPLRIPPPSIPDVTRERAPRDVSTRNTRRRKKWKPVLPVPHREFNWNLLTQQNVSFGPAIILITQSCSASTHRLKISISSARSTAHTQAPKCTNTIIVERCRCAKQHRAVWRGHIIANIFEKLDGRRAVYLENHRKKTKHRERSVKVVKSRTQITFHFFFFCLSITQNSPWFLLRFFHFRFGVKFAILFHAATFLLRLNVWGLMTERLTIILGEGEIVLANLILFFWLLNFVFSSFFFSWSMEIFFTFHLFPALFTFFFFLLINYVKFTIIALLSCFFFAAPLRHKEPSFFLFAKQPSGRRTMDSSAKYFD